MAKSEVLRYSNLLLALSVLIQAGTGLIFFFGIKIPDKELKEFILDLHGYNGLVLFTLVVLHLFLNWNWIKTTFFPRKHASPSP